MAYVPLNLISACDVGDIVAQLVTSRDTYLRKTLHLCGDKLSMVELSAVLSQHLAPSMRFHDKQVRERRRFIILGFCAAVLSSIHFLVLPVSLSVCFSPCHCLLLHVCQPLVPPSPSLPFLYLPIIMSISLLFFLFSTPPLSFSGKGGGGLYLQIKNVNSCIHIYFSVSLFPLSDPYFLFHSASLSLSEDGGLEKIEHRFLSLFIFTAFISQCKCRSYPRGQVKGDSITC